MVSLAACAPHVQLSVAPAVLSADWDAESTLAWPDEATAPLDWAAFGSPQLDALLVRARAANADVAIASTRIRLASADLRIVRAEAGPSLNALGRAESNSRGGAGDNAFRDSYVTGELDFSYTLDLSGQLKASRRAAFARYRASGHEADAVKLTVEAAVASAYVEYAALSDRIAIADQNLAQSREFERILSLREQAGVVSELDLSLQTAQTNALLVGLSRLKESRSRVRNALAVLVGEEAPIFTLDPASLSEFTAPRFAPLQPSALLIRRPDMLAASALIEAANGDVARARAAFVPDLQISGGSFVDSVAGGGLLNPGFALASRFAATIFDSGRLKGAVFRASAEQTQAVEQFRKALLKALEDTQNALAASHRTQERLRVLDQSRYLATRSAALARQRFLEGSDDFGAVLDAERRKLQVEDDLIVSTQESLNAVIALYAAVGGKPS
ncbi:efflux transporter outer membrane subunit [Blastomonas sp. AAP53]|uniref:efflux transporter outer membrane subunit n=1 Tax=Blastomonas sp. AAP53 TaxID=1248760 RepID=UPI0002D374A2|nr:efflux transporter outer membrane subunit [Blastomonas sp. AAP53]